MTFVCQIVIPREWREDESLRVAYVFMTGAGFDHRAMETWNPDEGETCVIVQAAGASRSSRGPYPDTLKMWREQDGRRTEVPCEFAVDEAPAEEAAYVRQADLDKLPATERNAVSESWHGNKIGGSPYWIQYEELPYTDWWLLLQLEDGTYPFNLNLGTGIGYVFLNSACDNGKLLWQC